jgi:general secretion pathway protein K
MARESFNVLRPHITALPGRTNININTATGPVLQSLDENLSAADVERLLAEREIAGFADIQSTFSSLVTPDVLNTLDDSTNYFQLKVVVRIDTVRVTLYSVLQRGSQGSVAPILRSLGTT